MYEFENLLDAMEDYNTTKRKLDKAAAKYDGVSPGYHLFDENEAYDKAKEEFKQAFNKYIQSQIKEINKSALD